MIRLLEKIRDTSTMWFDELSDRERRLIVLLFAAICVVLVFVIVYVASSSISEKRTRLDLKENQLAQINELRSGYLQARAREQSANRRIRLNRISLFTYIQEVTSKLGLNIKDLNEQRRPVKKADIVEVLVRLNLNKLSIDKVTALIEDLESPERGEPVKVTRLKISKRYDEPDLLDIQMTVSTWKSA